VTQSRNGGDGNRTSEVKNILRGIEEGYSRTVKGKSGKKEGPPNWEKERGREQLDLQRQKKGAGGGGRFALGAKEEHRK